MLHRLRPADTSDFEWLLALDRSSRRGYVEQVRRVWDDAEHRTRFTRAFAARPMTVVEVDGEAAGVISVEGDADPIVVLDVQLDPRWQGRGLGTRLVHDILLGARARGRAVELKMIRPNPARALYERLGFAVVGEDDSQVHLRWEDGEEASATLRAAMSPWTDARRRSAWVYRLFDSPPDPHVGFCRFIVGRTQRPEALAMLDIGCGPGRMLRPFAALGWRVTAYEPNADYHAAAATVAAVAGPSVTTVHGGFGDVTGTASHDLAVAFNGSFWYLTSHRARVDALGRVRRALRPGGVLVLEGPNMPWVLKAYREPPARTELYHRATVSRIPAHTLDFHDGVLEHRDTFVVEVDGAVEAEWDERQRLALLGLPQIRLALEEAGLPCVETFGDLRAVGPGRVTGPRIVLTARETDRSSSA